MSTALPKIPGWYIEFQAALLRQAPRPDGIDQITAESWSSNQEALKRVLAGCLLPPPILLIEFIGLVTVPAITTKFVAKDKFVVNRDEDAQVKISYLGDNFKAWFLEKVEEPMGEQELRYHKLKQSSVDGPIIGELGGQAKVETALSQIFSFMEKQRNGEDDVLLNNGYANIFYIRDQTGVLRTVHVYWRGGGWLVAAYSVERPRRWSDSFRVFSRNS